MDFSLIAAAQLLGPDVAAMKLLPSLNVVSKLVKGVVIFGDVSTGVFRPLVPPAFREQVFLHLHNISHPGIRASRRLVCRSFCWSRMSRVYIYYKFFFTRKVSNVCGIQRLNTFFLIELVRFYLLITCRVP